jgi:hypothetical protein
MPRLTGQLQRPETGLPSLPLSCSPTVFSVSGPGGLLTIPWAKKKQLKICHFSSDAEIIPATENWLDGQISEFVEWFARVRVTG